MFSIIIPLYNKAAYIEKAISSVLAQTFQEFELIVIDDGSTDIAAPQPPKGGVSITYNYIEALIGEKGLFVIQSNAGVSVTRNRGVELAKNDYIAFLDADDWWEPTYLEEMKGLIEEFPEAGIYGSSYFKVKNGINIPADIGVDADFRKGIINYCQVYAKTFYMPLWTGATIIKKGIYKSENGFKPKLILGEDFDLWIRVALKNPVAFLNKQLAYYNQDVSNVDKAVVKNRIYHPDAIYIFNLDYLSEDEKVNPDLKRLLDILRVYTLLRYRLQRVYPELVKKEVGKVDFSKMSFRVRLNYILPVSILNFEMNLRGRIGRLMKFVTL